MPTPFPFAFNKNVLQKDRGGFRNGPWTGQFLGENGRTRYFNIHLRFHKNGSLEGEGHDEMGKMKIKNGTFTMHETPCVLKSRLKWENSSEMTLDGKLDAETGAVTGSYSFPGGEGTFSMQPTITGLTPSGSPPSSGPRSSPRAGGTTRLPKTQLHGRRTPPVESEGTAPGGRAADHSLAPTSSSQQVRQLMEMGFDQRVCQEAVSCAGTLEAQIEWIYSHGSSRPQAAVASGAVTSETSDDSVAQLVSMGFSLDAAKLALAMSRGDLGVAAEWLVQATTEDISRATRSRRAGGGGDTNLLGVSAPEKVRQLMDLLHCQDEALAREALAHCGGNVEMALNWVFSRRGVTGTGASTRRTPPGVAPLPPQQMARQQKPALVFDDDPEEDHGFQRNHSKPAATATDK
eukprot:RCo019832